MLEAEIVHSHIRNNRSVVYEAIRKISWQVKQVKEFLSATQKFEVCLLS